MISHRLRGMLLLVVPVAVVLLWLVLYPNLFVLADSLRTAVSD